MSTQEFFELTRLSVYYEVDMSFFSRLSELGLIQIHTIDQEPCIHQDGINGLERILRMHRELEINPEGIDTVLNLLEKIETLQAELSAVKNKLQLYEAYGRSSS